MHSIVMATLFALAGGFLWWVHREASRVAAARGGAREWRNALRGVGWIIVLALLVNAQAFAKMKMIACEVDAHAPVTWRDLLASHAVVLCGTASPMWLVVRSIGQPAVLRENQAAHEGVAVREQVEVPAAVCQWDVVVRLVP